MPSIHFQGGQLGYRQTGKGSRHLVLIHGFGEDSTVWEGFAAAFAGKELTLTLPDLPGFGSSEALHPHSIDLLADAMAALIEALQLPHAVVIGHSMGGYTALNLVRRYPGLPLRGFGLFHSHPYADEADKKSEREKTAEFIRKNGSAAFARTFAPGLFGPDFRDARAWIARMTERAAAFPAESLATASLAMRDRADETATLKSSRLPVLFLLGDADGFAPLQKVLPQTLLPDISMVHLLEGVGHMGMIEAPELCQQHVESFVDFCYSSRA